MIIGLSGKLYSGKNTVASIIQYLMVMHRPEGVTGWTKEGLVKDLTQGIGTFDYSQSRWKCKSWAYKVKEIVCILTGFTMEQLENQEFKKSKMPAEWGYWAVGQLGKELTYLFDTHDKANTFIMDARSGHPYGIPVYILPTVRQFMQKVGTDCIRNIIHPNSWVNALLAEYKPGIKKFYLDDSCKVPGARWKIPEDHRLPKRLWGSFSASKFIEYMEHPNWIITDTRFENEAEAIKQHGGLLVRVDRDMDRSGPEHKHPSETALDHYRFDAVISNNGSLESLVNMVELLLQSHKLI